MTFLASCICPRATKRRLYCHRWISFRHLLLQEGFYCTSYYCSYKQSNNRPCSFKPYCEKQPYRICSKLPQGLLYPHIHSFIASMCKTLFKGATQRNSPTSARPNRTILHVSWERNSWETSLRSEWNICSLPSHSSHWSWARGYLDTFLYSSV